MLPAVFGAWVLAWVAMAACSVFGTYRRNARALRAMARRNWVYREMHLATSAKIANLRAQRLFDEALWVYEQDEATRAVPFR